MQLKLQDIRLDGNTQPRSRVYDETVTAYTEALLDGAKFPPVDVFFDGKHYWLADGFHRYHAHRRNKHNTIDATIHKGTKRDAFIFSRGANAEHGMPRTNEEKRAVVISLLEDPEFYSEDQAEEDKPKDRLIARICKVSNMTVGRIRKQLALNKKQSLPEAGRFPGRRIECFHSDPTNKKWWTRSTSDSMTDIDASSCTRPQVLAKLK